jgi:group I intron endonuclease
MNSILSTSNERKSVWEENDSIGPKTNCSGSNDSGQAVITGSTENNSIRNLCNGTGKISGIYKIINKVNGNYYVGSAQNIRKRWNYHRRLLNNGHHDNSHLQNAWNKYGSINFYFIVIEKAEIENLLDEEQKYLNICKNNPNNAYNMSYDASAPMRGRTFSIETKLKMRERMLKYRHSEQSKLKISQSRMGRLNPFYGIGPIKAIRVRALRQQKKILQVDKNGNTLTEFDSIKLASEKLHIPRPSISRTCSGEYQQTHGLFFKFKE